MATNESLYEWAQRAPQALAALAGLKEGSWHWSSVTLKRMERRADGVLEPDQPGIPVLFTEFQACRDDELLWRWLWSIVTWVHQKRYRGPVTALVIYLESSHQVEPGLELGLPEEVLLRFQPRSMVLSRTAPDTLRAQGRIELIPLLPLTQVSKKQLEELLPVWARELQESALDETSKKDLLVLLGAFASHRLNPLPLEKLEKLLGGLKMRGTPLGDMLIEEGRQEGRQEGRLEGRQEGRQESAWRFLSSLSRERFGVEFTWLSDWATGRPAELLERAGTELLRSVDAEDWRRRLESLDPNRLPEAGS